MIDKIGIFIPTCNRMRMLDELLNKLINNKFIRTNFKNIFIYVIDNDINGSSKCIVEKYIQYNVFYFIEYKKGYSSVRNKCLEIARNEECEYMVFIDDDEYPDENWLENMYSEIVNYRRDAIIGPVYAIIDNKAPNWIKENKHNFDRCNKEARYTGNSMFNMKSIDNIYFDNNFDKYGGEDVNFFASIEKSGRKNIVFLEKAKVYEYMPLNRTKLKWFIKRAYNSGISDVIYVKSKRDNKEYIKAIFKAMYNIISGGILLLLSVFRNKNSKRIALTSLFKGFGRIYSFIFIRYDENLNLNSNSNK